MYPPVALLSVLIMTVATLFIRQHITCDSTQSTMNGNKVYTLLLLCSHCFLNHECLVLIYVNQHLAKSSCINCSYNHKMPQVD